MKMLLLEGFSAVLSSWRRWIKLSGAVNSRIGLADPGKRVPWVVC